MMGKKVPHYFLCLSKPETSLLCNTASHLRSCSNCKEALACLHEQKKLLASYKQKLSRPFMDKCSFISIQTQGSSWLNKAATPFILQKLRNNTSAVPTQSTSGFGGKEKSLMIIIGERLKHSR